MTTLLTIIILNNLEASWIHNGCWEYFSSNNLWLQISQGHCVWEFNTKTMLKRALCYLHTDCGWSWNRRQTCPEWNMTGCSLAYFHSLSSWLLLQPSLPLLVNFSHLASYRYTGTACMHVYRVNYLVYGLNNSRSYFYCDNLISIYC